MRSIEALRPGLVVGVVLFGGLLLLPVFAGTGSDFLATMEYVLALTMVAVGLNIVTGFAGQLSLGSGPIFAVAAYAAAITASHFPASTGLAVMCAVGLVSAAATGFVIGIPALRTGGFYLAMVTLLVALVVPVLGENLAITGGSSGISLFGIADFNPRWSGSALYEIGVGLLLVITLGSWLLLHSRTGVRFLLTAASEDLGASVGVPIYRTKVTAFVLSALPAGLGGAYFVYSQEFMGYQSAPPQLAIYLLAACVIGGLGTIIGPVVGGLIVMCLTQFVGGFTQYAGVILGVLLALMALLMPDGLAGFAQGPGRQVLASWIGRLSSRTGESGPPTVTPPTARVAARLAPAAGDPASAVLATSVPATSTSPPAVPAPADASGPVRGGDRKQPAAELRVVNVTRAFGGVTACADVSMTIRPGELNGLIGSNGSGKTTLLNIISGFYPADSGELNIGDRRIDHMAANLVAGLGVARTFQTPKLVHHLTIEENVTGAAYLADQCSALASVLRLPQGRRADRAATARARDCLEAVGLADRADQHAGKQDHGTLRLIEIARAMASRPRFLLLDEPAAGLSVAELETLRSVIGRIQADGVGVLLVEHNVPFVLELASHMTVLHEGRCIAEGTPDEMRANETVKRSFLGAML